MISELRQFEQLQFLSVEEWEARRFEWAQILEVDPSVLVPGMDVGPPQGVCSKPIKLDVVFPNAPGAIWVRDRVRDLLVDARVNGIDFAEVELSGPCGDMKLFELVVRGRAMRKDSTLESLRACDICNRSRFPDPDYLEVDESTWDGSDFLHVDGNSGITIVTERVADLLRAHGVSNIELKPIKRAAP